MPRYIDVDEFVKRVIQYPRQSTKTIGLALADTPTADVVPVVRCKDCEHHREQQIGFVNCLYHLTTVDDDGFCKWGERRTDARMD